SLPRGPARAVSGRAGRDAARRAAGDEEPLRDAARREGARDASSRAADDDAADERAGAAPHAPDAGADGADVGRGTAGGAPVNSPHRRAPGARAASAMTAGRWSAPLVRRHLAGR